MTGRIPDYDELKLRIERGTGESYHVVAFAADGSTAEGTFSSPFSATELDNFVLRVGLPRRKVRTYRSSQMEEARRFGTELSRALLHGDVREVYLGARRAADAEDRGLRVTLYLTGVPELMEIPWEFLYERPSFLSQSIYTPLVRSLDLKTVRPPRRVALPLRVLGVVSSPSGLDQLDVNEEQDKLERALGPLRAAGMVEVDWLQAATLSELERAISAPDERHVLHFVGHGAYDERTQGGMLLLEGENGGAHEVTGEELGSLLYDERSLRLAVLNSCEGARTSHVDPFSGVASSLLECGIPAVVGMQFEITDDAAIRFSERLYTALAQGFPVDAALAQARKGIFAAGHEVEFGTPVLYLRGADARLFDVDTALPAPEPVSPPPPPPEPAPPPELRPAPRRKPRIAAVLAAVAALVIAAGGGVFAVAGGGGGDPPPPPPRDPPPPKPEPKPQVGWAAFTPSFGGYSTEIPSGAGWSAAIETEEATGRRYRAVIPGPGRLFALIDYTPRDPAEFQSDYESRRTVAHPAFGSAVRYVSTVSVAPRCENITCVDYIINDRRSGAGYAVLGGGTDLAKADRFARRIANSLVPRKEPQ